MVCCLAAALTVWFSLVAQIAFAASCDRNFAWNGSGFERGRGSERNRDAQTVL